jgi:hypothetical protein
MPSAKTRRTLVYTLILFAASVLYTQAGFHVETQAVTVPLVERLNDPSLFAGDRFAEALMGFPSVLWHVVAAAARVVPLGPLLLVLFLLERILVIYAAGRLARAFVPGSELAPVGAMALFGFAIRPLLGSGTLVEDYFEHTGLAVALLLLAIAAFHEARPVAWAVWTALAFNSTSMYGTFALAYFGAVFLVDPGYRRDWIRWARAFGLMLALSVFPLVLAARAFADPLRDRAIWLKVSRFRSWWHMYPLRWETSDYLVAGALLGLLLLFVGLAGGGFHRLRKHALVWSGVAASWLALAFLGAYVFVSPEILLGQPGRATDLWICFAAVTIAAIGAVRLESGPGASFIEGDELSQETGGGPGRLSVAAFLGPFILWPPFGWIVAAAGLVGLVIPPVWRVVFERGNPRRVALLLVSCACLSALSLVAIRARRTGLADALVERPRAVVREAAVWARTSTPREAVFLVDPGDDPDWDHFMGLSERSIFANWEEGTAIHWSPNYAEEWVRRLELLGVDVDAEGEDLDPFSLGRAFEGLRDEDVARMRARTPIRYWVVPEAKRSGYPAVFRSGGYKVLDLGGELVFHQSGETETLRDEGAPNEAARRSSPFCRMRCTGRLERAQRAGSVSFRNS